MGQNNDRLGNEIGRPERPGELPGGGEAEQRAAFLDGAAKLPGSVARQRRLAVGQDFERMEHAGEPLAVMPEAEARAAGEGKGWQWWSPSVANGGECNAAPEEGDKFAGDFA